MVDVIIPLKTELQPTANVELKYALRSIEKYLKNVGRVFIIGSCPEWLNMQQIDYVPFKEKNWFTDLTKNIHDKLKLACEINSVSDTFLYFNDDHFLLAEVDAETFPFYHKGSDWSGSGQYLKTTIPATHKLFPQQLLDNYDTHAPMRINKQHYTNTVATLNWRKHFGYCIKTCYVYMNGFNPLGVFYPDLKIHEAPKHIREVEAQVSNRLFFSTGNKAMKRQYVDGSDMVGYNIVVDFLEKVFPEKSKYEI